MYFLKSALSALLLLCFSQSILLAQASVQDSLESKKQEAALSKWYEKLSLRGYSQFRYNRLLETNPKLKCEQCDKSIGEGQGFGFRRARLVFSGQVHSKLFVYLQYDYSSDVSSSSRNFLQVRDAYFDYSFDEKKEYRVRFGQSKVPFGYENMQSSSNRLPFDRADALNSAAPNEREFGVFFMYTPQKIRENHQKWANARYKGNGDYGAFTLGLYNGQTTNRPELNDNLHSLARVTYPISIRGQIIEPSLQAYTGFFTIPKENLSAGVRTNSGQTYLDRRAAASINIYPKPFGLLAEYNIGKSPGFNAATDSIEVRDLRGGFVTLSYCAELKKGSTLFPFIRYQYYDGAKKHETDARMYEVKELEFGAEWSVFRNLEITLSYVISARKYQDFKTDYDEQGRFLRIQVQANY
jgi:hypothetical protein